MNPPAKQPALVDVTDREQLGVFAFERFEIELYFTHLLLKIACRDERSGTLYEFFLKIDAIKENRNLSFKRNVIEPLFPIRVERAGALGGDTKTERARLLGCVGQVVGHAGVTVSKHGDAAQPSEQRSERPEEPFFLHQEVDVQPFGTGIELSEDKIPIAGVGCETNNKFLRMVYRHVGLPT